jgi:hypothetical protein
VEGNEAEADTCNETESNTGLCEVFATYNFNPEDLQAQFVNGVLQRTIFYFGSSFYFSSASLPFHNHQYCSPMQASSRSVVI